MSRHVGVVGGGVVGLATAYYLRRAGADVTVVDRGVIGSGASSGNSGWIAPTFAGPLAAPGMAGTAVRALARPNGSFYLSLRHLPRLAPWLWGFWRASTAARHEAGMLATARLALDTQLLYDELAADGVDFEMKTTGVAHAFTRRKNAETAHRRLSPLRTLGYEVPERVLDGEQLRGLEPAFGEAVVAGFIVPGERTVYPPSLLAGLHARLRELGVMIHEHRPVSGFDTHDDSIAALRAGGERIEVDEVVLAAGVWTRRLAAQLGVDIPLEAGKGYSFTALSPVTMPSHCLHLFEASVAASPFDRGLRIAGTMELSGMSPVLNRRRIAAVARAAQPYLNGWSAESRRDEWMGMRPMTSDGLPVIGQVGRWRNLTVATGHGMLGVMLAPVTGRHVARLLSGDGDSEDLRPFSPDRFAR